MSGLLKVLFVKSNFQGKPSYTHLLATDARHQLNKKGGHSSEEDRQKLFTESCERYQLSGKILLADCDWAGTPVYW